MSLRDLRTPFAAVDRGRVEVNCARMRERVERHGARLRPHVKTAKCVEVADIALGDGARSITVRP